MFIDRGLYLYPNIVVCLQVLIIGPLFCLSLDIWVSEWENTRSWHTLQRAKYKLCSVNHRVVNSFIQTKSILEHCNCEQAGCFPVRLWLFHAFSCPWWTAVSYISSRPRSHYYFFLNPKKVDTVFFLLFTPCRFCFFITQDSGLNLKPFPSPGVLNFDSCTWHVLSQC